MKEVVLVSGEVVLVDDRDYLRVVDAGPWNLVGQGYAGKTTREGGTKETVYLHKFIVGAGRGEMVDHINGDKLDCRRSNLRPATRQQNGANRRKSEGTSSQYKGVSRNKGRGKPWFANIRFEGRLIYLGLYDVEEDAARAYDRKALELFGDFARLNFPREDYEQRRAA